MYRRINVHVYEIMHMLFMCEDTQHRQRGQAKHAKQYQTWQSAQTYTITCVWYNASVVHVHTRAETRGQATPATLQPMGKT